VIFVEWNYELTKETVWNKNINVQSVKQEKILHDITP